VQRAVRIVHSGDPSCWFVLDGSDGSYDQELIRLPPPTPTPTPSLRCRLGKPAEAGWRETEDGVQSAECRLHALDSSSSLPVSASFLSWQDSRKRNRGPSEDRQLGPSRQQPAASLQLRLTSTGLEASGVRGGGKARSKSIRRPGCRRRSPSAGLRLSMIALPIHSTTPSPLSLHPDPAPLLAHLLLLADTLLRPQHGRHLTRLDHHPASVDMSAVRLLDDTPLGSRKPTRSRKIAALWHSMQRLQ